MNNAAAPAFPNLLEIVGPHPLAPWERRSFPGITKREWFAAHAPDVPDWFGFHGVGTDEEKGRRFFRWRWYYADTMLGEMGGKKEE